MTRFFLKLIDLFSLWNHYAHFLSKLFQTWLGPIFKILLFFIRQLKVRFQFFEACCLNQLFYGRSFAFFYFQSQLDYILQMFRIFGRNAQRNSRFLKYVTNLYFSFTFLKQRFLACKQIKNVTHLPDLRFLSKFILVNGFWRKEGRYSWLAGISSSHREISKTNLLTVKFRGNKNIFRYDSSMQEIDMIHVQEDIGQLYQSTSYELLRDIGTLMLVNKLLHITQVTIGQYHIKG